MVSLLSNKRQYATLAVVVLLIMLVGLLPSPIPALAQEDTINGDWEFDVENYRVLQSDGTTHEANRHTTIGVRLSEVENGFTGRYIYAADDICPTEVSGTIQDNQVNWVTRSTGSCCQDAEMKFDGTISPDRNAMTGTMNPVEPPPSSNCGLWWANVTGARLHSVGTERPEGPIAFVSDRDGNREIYVMNADGSGVTNLTNNYTDDRTPAWSPDGSRIAFVSDRDGEYDIYVMNADGSEVTNLTYSSSAEGRANWDPAWSPDGARIAFASYRDGNLEIYVMNADGSRVTNVTNHNFADFTRSPAWSPDGARIAFVEDRDGAGDIYVMNADGSDVTNLTNSSVYNADPTWSPNGTRIAFVSDRDGNSEIYVMNADGSNQINISRSAADDLWPSWSPVRAIPNQPPVIILVGPDPLNVTQGCPFIDPKATATDAEDGDLTNSIIVEGSVNINAPRPYLLTYKVKDSDGLWAVKTRQVIVFGVIGTPTCLSATPEGKAPNLIVYVHGCCTDAHGVYSLRKRFGDAINQAFSQNPPSEAWEVVVWDWHEHTPRRDPSLSDWIRDARAARENILMHSDEVYLSLKDAIANNHYKHVHLIGHSAGAQLIQLTADELVHIYNQIPNIEERPFIHLTFLDAFTMSAYDKDNYGSMLYNYQNYYAEHYVHRGLAFMDISTDECLPNAFNFNITDWEHPPAEDGFFGHSWPVNWYIRSITAPEFNDGFPGFPLSFEDGNDQFEKLDEKYLPGKQSPLVDEKTKSEPAACW